LKREEKLKRIKAFFDVWIDVQRQRVYLVKISSGNAYQSRVTRRNFTFSEHIGSDFLTLMKKVTESPKVMNVLVVNIFGVQRSSHPRDRLGIAEKALEEYIERERTLFSGFYFVGDEDLLEIIGKSKNIPRLQKHFEKNVCWCLFYTVERRE
jgi:dynein heavy chain 1